MKFSGKAKFMRNLFRICNCLSIWLCFTNTDTATITGLATETTQIGMSTPESPTLGTDVLFTGIDSSISQISTLENEVLSSNEPNEQYITFSYTCILYDCNQIF